MTARRRYIRATGLGMCLVLAGLAGCSALQLNPLTQSRPVERDPTPGLPGKHSARVSQFVFFADFEIPRHQPIFRDLGDLREQVIKELHLPQPTNLIQVYLFEDEEKYLAFMKLKYPDLPKRRAFFVAQPRRFGGEEDLLVYTYWGDRIQQDLRHELTHALLHSVLKDVPLWLDEGLAEYFEMPASWKGVNYQHLEQLRRGPTGPARCDLARLEQMKELPQMTHAEYREAWAWVHLMLRTTPQARNVLIQYLHELRSNPRPGPFQPRLAQVFLSLDDALQRHLNELDLNRPKTSAAVQ